MPAFVSLRRGQILPVILAHGALGPFDEIIFIGIAVVFLLMMGVSWLRSQDMPADEFPADDMALEHDDERFTLE